MLFRAAVWVIITLAPITLLAYYARNRGVSVFVGAYVGLVITSIVVATKIIFIGPFSVPAGVIVYSASFLVTDLISELYGKRRAAIAVNTGFLMMLMYFVYAIFTVEWPAAEFWPNQEAYAIIVGQSWRIAIAGAIAFIISQRLDVLLFHFFKARQGSGRWALGIRNIASTSISQLIDSTIFITIAFYGSLPLVPLVLGQWAIKVAIALADTPFVYLGVHIVRTDDDITEGECTPRVGGGV